MELSDICSARACPLTGAHDAVLLTSRDRHGGELKNICWKDTGFIGVDPIPMPDVEEFYKTDYRQQYKGSFSPQKRHVLRAARCALDRFRRIRPYLNETGGTKLRTLDAGASSGEFVFLMNKLGHAAMGIEPNSGYAEHAKKQLGLNVANCTFSEFTAPAEKFNLITLFHVLEHLEFPVEELRLLSAMLQNDGLFVIEVPNILYPRMKFSHKWHKAHLTGFSAKTLEVTAARAGLHALTCGEIGDGGNLFGVFKPAPPISENDARERLQSHFHEAVRALEGNSDLNYYSLPSTWLKIPSKLTTQIEERRTANSYSTSVEILDAVYRDAAGT
jgi:2-polyprenyl-3-methyl-5-hydroxy-6-metoxy-1,4-benzoquinol methylase